MKTIATFVAISLLAPLVHASEPTTEEIIAKAREYLGGDAALDRITSISYEAEFTTREDVTGTMRIIFQKPLQQRVEILRGELGEITALNDFDGWRKVYSQSDGRDWSITLLDAPQIRELQANTFENLNFFQGIEQQHGRLENKGTVEVDGRDAVEISFRYPRGITFTRYFDVETGRLLMTRTHMGAELRETGTILVDGVVFPETLTMARDGEVLNTIHFKKITLNEEFPESLFAIPSLAPRP